jgi:hypothetical protein
VCVRKGYVGCNDFLAHPSFIAFGLLARPNGTVITSLAISALSVSSAIFLILELFSPHTGVIKVSSAPFRAAFMQLGK